MTVAPSNSAQQISAQATSDASGNATFNFPMAPQGYVITGTVSIPTAPILTQIAASLSGLVIGMWRGSNPWGPIEALSNQILSLSVTNLTPNTFYNAVWMAQCIANTDAPGNTPAALLTTEVVAVQSFSQLLGTETSAGTPLVFGGIPDNTESLLLVADSASGTSSYSVVGDVTGATYLASYGIPVTSAEVGYSVIVPIVGLIDTSVTITPDTLTSVTLTVYALSTVPELPIPTPQAFVFNVSTSGLHFFGPSFIAALLWSFSMSVYSGSGAANAPGILQPVSGSATAEAIFALSPSATGAGNAGPCGPFKVDYAGQQVLQPAISALQPTYTSPADYQQYGILTMTVLG